MLRHDGRHAEELRKIQIERDVIKYPEGSILITFGDTKVLCSATVEESVPPFLKGSGSGWVTAEYSMLPRATNTRNRRESIKGKLSGRTMEIQRLIGRSLRSVVDLSLLGERSILIDCDVLQADGGTRTASITGAFIAMKLAVNYLLKNQVISSDPIREYLAAISVGVLDENRCVVDLDYQEDYKAHVDMNIVMTESSEFVEIQGTGESTTFSSDQLNTMLSYARQAIEELIVKQKAIFSSTPSNPIQINEKMILIATRNDGKAKEFSKLFAEKGYQIRTLLDFPELPDVEETGTSFEENARLKAETIADIIQQPVLADDSGLIVDALNGLPGIYSARFAGVQKSAAANNAKLLYELTDIPDEERTARYHCTLVLAKPGKESLVVSSEWEGIIGRIPRGQNGFGYDPLFQVPSEEKTAAEMSEQRKNEISHRGKAIKELGSLWKDWMKES